MITKILLRAPKGGLRLIAPDGSEICADENGEFDITEYPNLALNTVCGNFERSRNERMSCVSVLKLRKAASGARRQHDRDDRRA
jgi:hypothetical protein